MFFFQIEVIPKPDAPQASEVRGALAHCWIDFKRADGAEILARHYIDESGWIFGQTLDRRPVTELDYVGHPEWLKFFIEAKQEGVCLAYHTWTTDEALDDLE
jgi:hypothetical protein